MARWLSLLLLVGFTSAVLTHGWAGSLGLDAPLAVDVQETLPSVEAEGEDATLAGLARGTASSRPSEVASAALLAGQSRRVPDLRPPR